MNDCKDFIKKREHQLHILRKLIYIDGKEIATDGDMLITRSPSKESLELVQANAHDVQTFAEMRLRMDGSYQLTAVYKKMFVGLDENSKPFHFLIPIRIEIEQV